MDVSSNEIEDELYVSLWHKTLGDVAHTNSLCKAFVCSPERIFYAYYSEEPSHSIEDGMSSRDKVQD